MIPRYNNNIAWQKFENYSVTNIFRKNKNNIQKKT